MEMLIGSKKEGNSRGNARGVAARAKGCQAPREGNESSEHKQRKHI